MGGGVSGAPREDAGGPLLEGKRGVGRGRATLQEAEELVLADAPQPSSSEAGEVPALDSCSHRGGAHLGEGGRVLDGEEFVIRLDSTARLRESGAHLLAHRPADFVTDDEANDFFELRHDRPVVTGTRPVPC